MSLTMASCSPRQSSPVPRRSRRSVRTVGCGANDTARPDARMYGTRVCVGGAVSTEIASRATASSLGGGAATGCGTNAICACARLLGPATSGAGSCACPTTSPC